jgi:formate hydrogenlyase subunit 3/multisubunit Na+/H+ antiporter MnhD subunit
MSAPLVWIGLPLLVGGILFLLRGYHLATSLIGGLLSALLSISAWLLPIGEVITLGTRVFKISERFSILGRDFILMNTDRAWLLLIYFFLSLWVFGSLFARAHNGFVPFGFIFSSLLVAALAVEPFLYAALLIEIAVLLAVPFLSPPEQQPGSGIYRFLAFQSLGMPFILLAGWFLAGLEASPGESELVLRAGALIGFGLAFLLSVVPFHSWIPTLIEESEPYITAFILFILPAFVAVFGLGFLDRFVWLRDSESVYTGLRLVGGLMILVGGGWAAMERHLGRMLGYGMIIEIGISLLAVGIGGREGVLLFFWLMFARVFSMMPWAAAISYLWEANHGDLDLDSLRGIGHRFPFASGILMIGGLSLAGIPLLAGFSARFAFWRAISGAAPLLSLLALAGNAGLVIASLRVLFSLFISFPDQVLEDASERSGNAAFSWLFVSLLAIFLAVVGFFPQIYLPSLERLLFIFERLGA